MKFPRLLQKQTGSGLALVLVSGIAGGTYAHAADINPPPIFHEVYSYSLGGAWCENHLSVADMDGDGHKDIVLMATSLTSPLGPPWQYAARAILLRAALNGTFTENVITNFHGKYGYGAFVADLNNDGTNDLILRENSATHVRLNDGDGGFEEVWSGQPGYYHLTFIDANRDGLLDFVSGTQTGLGGLLELFINDGTGRNFRKSWQSRYFGSGSDSIQTVLNVNLNGDDLPDIAAREIYGGRMMTFFGTNGTTPLVERSDRYLGDRTFALAAGHVDRDGLHDLAVAVGWGTVQVYRNAGDGSLSNYWESPDLGQAAFNLALADFDQDGLDDIFVGTFGDGALRIYRNKAGDAFEPWWQSKVPGDGYTGTAADINGDGYPDLIVGEKNRLRILINRTFCPSILGLLLDDDGATVNWSAIAGWAYRLQFKASLADGDWTDIDGDVVASASTASKVDPVGSGSGERYYRVLKLR